MDDIMSRINDLLSDEESVRQLSELAQILVSGNEGESQEAAQSKSEEETSGQFSDQPDISSILRLTSLIGSASQQDKNTDLLLALKPHLKEEKQKRVDKAIKLLKMLAIWNIAKESGLLQELI